MNFGTIYKLCAPYLTGLVACVVAWLLSNRSSSRQARRTWNYTLKELALTKENNAKVQGRAYKLQFILKELEKRSLPYTKAASDANVVTKTISANQNGITLSQEIVLACNNLIDDIHKIVNQSNTTQVLIRNIEPHMEQEYIDYILALDEVLGHKVEIMVHDIATMVVTNQEKMIQNVYSEKELRQFIDVMDELTDFMMKTIQLTLDQM